MFHQNQTKKFKTTKQLKLMVWTLQQLHSSVHGAGLWAGVCRAGVGVVCVSGVSRPTWVVQSGSSSIPQSGAEEAVKTCSDLNTVGGLWRSSANRITEEVKGRASWERVGRRLHSPALKHEGNLRITGLRITELLVGYFRGEKSQRINRDSQDVLIYRSRRTVVIASEHLWASSADGRAPGFKPTPVGPTCEITSSHEALGPKNTFPINLYWERSLLNLLLERHNETWLVSLSESDPFSPVTLGKSRRDAPLNYSVFKLAGS